jgi:N-acetylneuraminic acid mutarotase
MKKLSVGILFLPIPVLFFISILASPSLAQSWSEGAPMPTARSEITATNMGDYIYVIGGFDGSGDVLDVVEIYNIQNNSWKSTAPLPEPLHHTAATSHEGKIYVIGGYISREWIPTNQLFIYEPVKNQWKEGKPMPTPRGALSALFVNGTLYAIGGQDEARNLNINEAYDPNSNTWSSQKPMPTGRHHAASTTVDNKIFVIGGGPEPGLSASNVNEIYTVK